MSYPAVWADPIDHVRSLAEADTASATIDELKDLARPLVLGLNCKAAVIAAGTSLFRARIASCQPFQFINEVGYPRNQVRLQRVNRPGSPMFYSCGAPFAPVYELDPSVGTLFVLSHWATRRPLRVIAIGFQDSVLGRPPFARVHSFLSVHPPTPQVAPWVLELGKVIHLVHHCLSQWFSERVSGSEEHRYKRTVAIAELLVETQVPDLRDGTPALSTRVWDGVLYPSVPALASSFNIALFPEVADSSLDLVTATHLEVIKREIGTVGLTYDAKILFVANAPFPDGRLDWHSEGKAE